MQVRVITMRYSDGLQGFSEDALRSATSGREVLDVREHFFVHGEVPHLVLVLLLGDAPGSATARSSSRAEENPEQELPEALRPLYRSLRQWRNETAKQAGIPSYAILRNAQLAEICRRLPRSLAALREIEGIGEATCTRYGSAILALLPEAPPQAEEAQP